jgi:hypothetical protein
VVLVVESQRFCVEEKEKAKAAAVAEDPWTEIGTWGE